MNDRRSLAIVLGAAVGIAAVATTIGIYKARHEDEPVDKNVNDVLERARETVRKLDDAVEMLKKSAAA